MKTLLVFAFIIKLISGTAESPTPIVLWHGMGDTCCFSFSLGGFKRFLEKQIPGVYVLSIRVGDSPVEDLENSYFLSPNIQVAQVCDMLINDPELKDGFHAIGFSQGSQFLRGVAQRCGAQLKMRALITLGGQHQGVYGIPHCNGLTTTSCDYIRKLITYAAYDAWVQRHVVQATYWHDPLKEDTYKEKSKFIADINNENSINQTYIDNLNKLDYFVMVKFEQDSMVQPIESEWFGYYEPGQSKKLMTLQESKLYLEDRLGLQKMDKAGKLKFLSTPGDHLRFSDTWFIENIMKPYLLY